MNSPLSLNRWSSRLAVIAWCLLTAGESQAITLLFAEDFENVPLATAPTYGVPGVWSDDPPFGWEILNNVPPQGVPEWEGWAFADKTFWQAVGSNGRQDFNRGQGTVAVADPDLWNDTPDDPANRLGFYNTLLQTPQIPLHTVDALDDTLRLVFDSSWRGGCCDDGREFNPNGNNQTAFVRIRIDGGPPIEVLRWESSLYYEVDPNGGLRPTNEPFNNLGDANLVNGSYRSDALDETVYVDLSDFLPQGQSLAIEGAAAASSGSGSIEIEFGMEGAGDDGWWAIDNVEMVSMSTIAGDMNINSMLDSGDIDAFALGMRDELAYATTYYGAYPVDRGSDDSVFNFDDIPWFISIMEGAGEASASFALAQALSSVPEPSMVTLVIFGVVPTLSTRRRS